ncbi:MAG: 3-phosphoserine/phosphohydroxythreonine transaminase [Acidobacteriia bacterium]|nr:3-phosphoserine/phosphohydroxythreonine transaminase [Methyloceanibacter sp.]MCL6493076.1 3-phosphoserine/phosphohydroxythreonine transaminase [Terriglobia bacterium]
MPFFKPQRSLSFATGAGSLPAEVLAEIREGLVSWRGSGLSVLELPFTGAKFQTILAEAEQDLRDLLDIPASYRVLFLQGGAFAQFRLVPLNLLRAGESASYVETGYWSARAMAEARALCPVVVAARARKAVPPFAEWRIPPDAAYCHITTNETAEGVQFHEIPVLSRTPLVADMTADLLTGPLDIRRFGLIYASAQKNLGAAGLTLVIVREDLLGRGQDVVPAPLDYTRQARAGNRINTPPTFAIYVAGLMLKWLKRQGGLNVIAERNRRKAAKLYAAIETGGFYHCPVPPPHRSSVTVCFHLPDAVQEAAFLEAAAQAGLLNLQGHPAVGGIRAALYNGVTEAAVDALVAFMAEFAAKHAHR